MMQLELNNATLYDGQTALSMTAATGRLTCFTGGTPLGRRRWLHALMGFEPLTGGYVCLDGEPLTPQSAPQFRRLMAYAPVCLEPVGELYPVEPPTVEQVFHLRRNREQPISNAILAEEVRRVGGSGDPRFQLIAVASLLGTPIVLVDDPPVASVSYLRALADGGRLVVVASDEAAVHDACHLIVPIP